MFHQRPKTSLPQQQIMPSAETTEVAMNRYESAYIAGQETWHVHAGPLVGCTVIGAVAVLGTSERLVHLQHYRSPEREEGFEVFTRTMSDWAQETNIVSLIAGVLSPENKTKHLPQSGPWVRPLSVDDKNRIDLAALRAHNDVDVAFDTYLVGEHGWRRGDAYPGMDIVIPPTGSPVISISLS